MAKAKVRRISNLIRCEPLRSQGRPMAARRENNHIFWQGISYGLTSEEAASQAGIYPCVGTRIFRYFGGMKPKFKFPMSGRFLSFVDREEIAILFARGHSVREIARKCHRSASTISRELRRNASTRSGQTEYRAITAQWQADRKAKLPKASKLVTNSKLRKYVGERLSGAIKSPHGKTLAGPEVKWNGRRHGRRKHRRWASAWSPEQIANRIRIGFSKDKKMRISHEAIY